MLEVGIFEYLGNDEKGIPTFTGLRGGFFITVEEDANYIKSKFQEGQKLMGVCVYNVGDEKKVKFRIKSLAIPMACVLYIKNEIKEPKLRKSIETLFMSIILGNPYVRNNVINYLKPINAIELTTTYIYKLVAWYLLINYGMKYINYFLSDYEIPKLKRR